MAGWVGSGLVLGSWVCSGLALAWLWVVFGLVLGGRFFGAGSGGGGAGVAGFGLVLGGWVGSGQFA